ncbi:MAG: hypothetical protein ACKVUS_06710 [Saprospiraceae bacterium]
MTASTIRGNFVTLLAQVEDVSLLKTMFENCLDLLQKSDPLAAHFPQELIDELDEAIAQSDDEAEAVSNEDAFKMFRQKR